MTARLANLLRFGAVCATIIWLFTLNAMAMGVQFIYVLDPATRVTGAPPMHWDQHQHEPLTGLMAAVHALATAPWMPTVALLAAPVLIYICYRLGAHKARPW